MKTAPWVIVTVLCLVLVFQIECHHCPDAGNMITSDTITSIQVIKGDSVPHELPPVVTHKPDSIVYQVIPADIDSLAVAMAYYSKVYGYVKMVDDSSLYVGFKYLVEQNRLKWVIPNVANRKETAIIHNTTYINQNEPRLKVFAGIGLSIYDTIPGLKQNHMATSLHGSIALLTKKDHLYTATLDPFRECYTITAYWKLKWPSRNKAH